MKLLSNFSAESFCRVIWKTQQARQQWEHTIQQIGELVSKLEVESVLAGHRRCAWQTVSEEQAVSFVKKLHAAKLKYLILNRVAKFEGFAHKHETPAASKSASLCFVIAKDYAQAEEFVMAYENGDSEAQGLLLGYPECCCSFFKDVWSKGFYDPIWQMAENSQHTVGHTVNTIIVKAFAYSNPLLRYIGVRAGFHIPCSFTCEETVKTGQQRMALAREVRPDLAEAMDTLLKMPMKWSVLNGIGQIETPLFYIITQSVPVAEKYEVITVPI